MADGRALKGDSLRRRMAMVTPELRFYPRLTARENMDFLLGLRGITLDEIAYRTLLNRVELREQEIGTAFAGEFSTGMLGD